MMNGVMLDGRLGVSLLQTKTDRSLSYVDVICRDQSCLPSGGEIGAGVVQLLDHGTTDIEVVGSKYRIICVGGMFHLSMK